MRRLGAALDRYADAWGAFFSSKWTVLLFSLIPLVAAPQAFWALVHGDFVTFVAWLSSNYWQLVALPVLAYLAKRVEQSHQAVHQKLDELHDKVDAAAGSGR